MSEKMSLKLEKIQILKTSEIDRGSIPWRPAAIPGTRGRAQRRQDAPQVPGIAAERCGIDPQSIFEVLKILKFFKIFKIFPRFGLPPGPGPWAHTGWLSEEEEPLLGGEAPSESWTPPTY